MSTAASGVVAPESWMFSWSTTPEPFVSCVGSVEQQRNRGAGKRAGEVDAIDRARLRDVDVADSDRSKDWRIDWTLPATQDPAC